MAAYRSTFVSAEQSRSWTKIDDHRSTNVLYNSLLVPITFWLTNLLLFVGSQPQPVQFLLVSLVNPIVLGVIASIGAFVVKQPAVGAPILVVAVLLACAALFIWLESSDNLRGGVESLAVKPIMFLQQHSRDAAAATSKLHKHRGLNHFEEKPIFRVSFSFF